MAMAEHGATIDLHGGGSDLIFPHHECEIAQTESVTGTALANHWMHTGLVAYQGTKMSKSLGNLVFISELRKTADPRAIRLALMAHHYRHAWEWFDDEIHDATERLERLEAAVGAPSGPDPGPFAESLRAALDDDLDTVTARDVLDSLARACLAGGPSANGPVVLRELAALCGLALP
jgi:L-cysteine:1D-myo-inositol 2-amino-2-deoxy-alpha-D-glucopyranoside ligase